MEITNFLKTIEGSRLTYYRRWMVWDNENEQWCVYKEGKKSTGIVCTSTSNIEIALQNLYYD